MKILIHVRSKYWSTSVTFEIISERKLYDNDLDSKNINIKYN